MPIYIRCPDCRTDNKKSSKKCRKCGRAWEKAKGLKFRLVMYKDGKRLPIKTYKKLSHAEIKEGKYKALKEEKRLDIKRVPRLREVWEELYERMQDRDYDEFKKSAHKDFQRWRDHVEPAIGKMKMDTITVKDIKKITDKMARTKTRLGEPYKPATREHVRKVIARLFNWANRHGRYTGHNPANELAIRFDNSRDIKLTLPQCENLIKICGPDEYAATWPEAAAIVKIAILTGRRRGEICAMEWQHADWEANVYKNKDTKSGDDLTLTMPDDVRDLLQSIGPKEEGLIFRNTRGENYYYSLETRWKEIKTLAELPEDFHFHDLRHSFASAYASSGEGDIYRLKELLGHKTLAMTLRYAHLFDEARQADANVVANQIKGVSVSEIAPVRTRAEIEQEFQDTVARIQDLPGTAAQEARMIAKAELIRDMELAEIN